MAGIKTLPTKTEESIKKHIGHTEGKILDGVSEITLSEPGVYRAMLTEVEVARSSDRTEFVVPLYVRDFRITENDLERGRYTIEISEPLFRIVVLDENAKAVPDKFVGFGGEAMILELKTNVNGEVFFLGDPSKYEPHVPDEPSLTVKTEAVPYVP